MRSALPHSLTVTPEYKRWVDLTRDSSHDIDFRRSNAERDVTRRAKEVNFRNVEVAVPFFETDPASEFGYRRSTGAVRNHSKHAPTVLDVLSWALAEYLLGDVCR
jgi:hypothetical protein